MEQDGAALIELYRRYAGLSLTLARQYDLAEPVQAVEDGFLMLFRSAPRFARCSCTAPIWILGMMQRYYRTLSPATASSPPQ